eukprot:759552-Pyramimonas_sp.AAC.1
MACTRLFGCEGDRVFPAHPYVAVCAQELGERPCSDLLASWYKDVRAPPFPPKSQELGPLTPNAALFQQRSSHGCRGVRAVFTSAFTAKGDIVHLR